MLMNSLPSKSSRPTVTMSPSGASLTAYGRSDSPRAKSLLPKKARLVLARPIPFVGSNCPAKNRPAVTAMRAAEAVTPLNPENTFGIMGNPASFSIEYLYVLMYRLHNEAFPLEIRIAWSMPSPSKRW
ncbi:hypothetical protein HanIR_Chr08g0370341 [Helianthus annuus]|nr:hypothetical protein HanIR_Chr08g0370341 [Helianthus annuus]